MPLDVTSEVDIASNALRLIGDQPITAFDDNSDRARLLNAVFNSTRDAVLRAHPWNFAVLRAALANATVTTVDSTGATVTTFPAFEFGQAYALPNAPYCLRVLYTDFEGLLPWRVEGRFLLTDAASVTCAYIARTTDVIHYDAGFVAALQYCLAANAAMPLKGDKNLAQALFTLYERTLQEARAMNGQEGTQPTLDVRTLLDVR